MNTNETRLEPLAEAAEPVAEALTSNRQKLHPLQKWGARAAIGSFLVGAAILSLTYINFQSPETKRREMILKELSYDFAASETQFPATAQEYRDAAAPYINRRLEEMNESWRFNPATDRRVPFR